MRRIPVGDGKFAIVSKEDFDRVSQHNWKWEKNNRCEYAAANIGRKKTYMHRFIMDPPKGMVVDHISDNGLNNMRGNLRVCEQKHNVYNKRKIISKCTSQYKGVCRDSHGKNWRATIERNGKKRHLGMFQYEKDAAKAYNEAALEYYGEYARLNDV